MITIKTAHATKPQLNWLLAKMQGFGAEVYECNRERWALGLPRPNHWNPVEDWNQGGPMLKLYRVEVNNVLDGFIGTANKYWWPAELGGTDVRQVHVAESGDYLLAGLKALVLAHYGETTEVPERV